jgi:uncharacterized RDD family membrane protein YckC
MLSSVKAFLRRRRARDLLYSSIVDEKRARVCLVIMDFAEEFLPRFETIKQVVAPLGFDVRRSERFSSATIAEKVVVDILAADIVIADLTDDNLNVLYEIGIADAMMRRVLLVRDVVRPEVLPIDLRARQVLLMPIAKESNFTSFSLAEAVMAAEAERPQNPVASVLSSLNVKIGRPLFIPRIAAGFIDLMLFSLLASPFSKLPDWVVWTMIVGIPSYQAALTHLWGGSAGKLLMGLEVRTWDGGRPGFGKIIVRVILAFPVPIGLWGFAMALAPPGYMALHDYVTKTQVVKSNNCRWLRRFLRSAHQVSRGPTSA